MASAQTVYLGPSVVVGDVDITPALAEHACLQRLQPALQTFGWVMVNWFSGADSDAFDVRTRFAALNDSHARSLAAIDALGAFDPGPTPTIDAAAAAVSALTRAYRERVQAIQAEGAADEAFVASVLKLEGELTGVERVFGAPTTGCNPALAKTVAEVRPQVGQLLAALRTMRLHVAQGQAKRLVLARMTYFARRDAMAREIARAAGRELDEVKASIGRIWLAASLQDEVVQLELDASRGGPARGLMSRKLQYLGALQVLRADRGRAEELLARAARVAIDDDLRASLTGSLRSLLEGIAGNERELVSRGWAGQLARQRAVADRHGRNAAASAACKASLAEHRVAADAVTDLTSFAAAEDSFAQVAAVCP
jgi:hypothetical protein